MKANARVEKMLAMAEKLRTDTGADTVEVKLNCDGGKDFKPFARIELGFDNFGLDESANAPAGSTRD